MSPAMFLLIGLGLSVIGSLIAWFVLRDRPASTDAMADFRRTMSALDPDGAKQHRDQQHRDRNGPKGSQRKR